MKAPMRLLTAAVASLLVAAGAQATDNVPSVAARAASAVPAAADATDAVATRIGSAATAAADRAAIKAEQDEARKEPAVVYTVIDDDRAFIEELRVRGQLTKAHVVPKGGAPGYEVIVDNGLTNMQFPFGQSGSRGAPGKRVWKLFDF